MMSQNVLYVTIETIKVFFYLKHRVSVGIPMQYASLCTAFLSKRIYLCSISQHLRVQTDELSSYLQLGDFGQPQFLNRLQCIH